MAENNPTTRQVLETYIVHTETARPGAYGQHLAEGIRHQGGPFPSRQLFGIGGAAPPPATAPPTEGSPIQQVGSSYPTEAPANLINLESALAAGFSAGLSSTVDRDLWKDQPWFPDFAAVVGQVYNVVFSLGWAQALKAILGQIPCICNLDDSGHYRTCLHGIVQESCDRCAEPKFHPGLPTLASVAFHLMTGGARFWSFESAPPDVQEQANLMMRGDIGPRAIGQEIFLIPDDDLLSDDTACYLIESRGHYRYRRHIDRTQWVVGYVGRR